MLSCSYLTNLFFAYYLKIKKKLRLPFTENGDSVGFYFNAHGVMNYHNHFRAKGMW